MENYFINCLNSYKEKIKYNQELNNNIKKDNFENFLLKYHYNKEDIIKIQNKNEHILETNSIILEHKVKQDYNEKYLFTPLSAETKVGDVYYWKRTDTYWIVYASYLTEKSYYKHLIKKADWCISWKDENDNICYQWVYVRGPVETKLDQYNSKTNIIDLSNGTLSILMPNNDRTKYFVKYKTIMLNNKKWRIVADEDDISNPFLREIQLEKIAINSNDDIENNIVDGLELNNFNFDILFNNELPINYSLDINKNVVFYKDNKIISNDFSVLLLEGNASIDNSIITFNQEGNCSFKIIYNKNPNIFKIINVNIKNEINVITNYKILGNIQPKTLFEYKYFIEYKNKEDKIEWKIIDDKKIVEYSFSNGDYIIIKYNQTGKIILQLLINDKLIDTKEIKVIGSFE